MITPGILSQQWLEGNPDGTRFGALLRAPPAPHHFPGQITLSDILARGGQPDQRVVGRRRQAEVLPKHLEQEVLTLEDSPFETRPQFHSLDVDDQSPEKWVATTLQELDEEIQHAEREGYSSVSGQTRRNAELVLRELSKRATSLPAIHASEDGSIYIDFRNPELDAAVLFVCEPDNEAACYYDVGDKCGRFRASETNDLLEFAGWGFLEKTRLVSRG